MGSTDSTCAGRDAGAEFIYTVMPSGASSGPLFQQGYVYPNCKDLCMGYLNDQVKGKQNILVAYYRQGVGHFLDIYEITNSTSAPLVLDTTFTLSKSPAYGRISMDTHDPLLGIVIVWQKPGTGIQAMVSNAGVWSGITTLSGTVDESAPDVAFSHSTGPPVGPLNAHFVYRNKTTGFVTTSSLDWPLLQTVPFLTTATMTPVIEDINTDPSVLAARSNMVIDCPDHYPDEDWAYTYTDGVGVFVRLRIGPNMRMLRVNDGSLGNADMVGPGIFFADNPTINFSGPMGIYVGWYSRFLSGDSHYIGLRMSPDGNSLFSAPDYMRLPNSVSAYSFSNSGVAFSKMNDINNGINPKFMYATFFKQKAGVPAYTLHHTFHPWFNPLFGTGGGNTYQCPGAQNDKPLAIPAKTKVYPNPFYNSIATVVDVPAAGTAELRLIDITGRLVVQQVKSLGKGTQIVRLDGLEQLTAGTYSLSIIVNGKNKGSQMVVKQK